MTKERNNTFIDKQPKGEYSFVNIGCVESLGTLHIMTTEEPKKALELILEAKKNLENYITDRNKDKGLFAKIFRR